MAAPNSNISMVVTACMRNDLLQQMLESFFANVDIAPQEILICEDSDSPMPEFLKDTLWRGRGVRWMCNEGRMGQIYTADRLLREIKCDFTFWAEEDWNFDAPANFMLRSKEILRDHPNIIQVSLRGDTGWHPLESGSYGFKIAKPYWRGVWGGFSFNPGLRRTADLRALGSFGRHVSYGTHGLGHEAELSKLFLDRGFRIADLGEEIVTHTGGSCSRAVEPLPAMPRVLIAVPVCHKYDYGKWESSDSPHFDQKRAFRGEAYGRDIHISGDGNRIAALRDTWLRDVAAFPFVDYKLFFGVPHGGRPALEDEIYLNCPDDYEHLPHKTIALCKWAYEHGYEWVFKADDDSFVWVDRLIQELLEHKHRMDYGGYLNGHVCSGGTGYWLSRRAMKLVSEFTPRHWAEDVTVAQCMDIAGIEPFMLTAHCPGFEDHWFNIAKVPANAVCIHAVKPEDMRTLYEREAVYAHS